MNFTQSQKPGAGAVIVNKPLLSHVVLFVLVGVVIGAAAAGFYFRGNSAKIKEECSAIQAQGKSDSASSEKSSGTVIPKKINIISGKIESVKGNILTFKAFIFGEEKIFQVSVTKDTKITKRKANQSQSEEKEVRLEDIRSGENAVIEASENVKDKTEFEAKLVLVLEIPAPPESPGIEKK